MEGRRKESVNPAHGCPKKRNRKKENIWYCVLLEHSGRGAEFVCRQTRGIRGVSGGNIIFLSTLSQRNFPHSAHDTQTSHFHWLQSNWDMSFMAFQPNFRWLFSLSFESVVSGVDGRRRRFHKCLRGLSSDTVTRQRKLISEESGGNHPHTEMALRERLEDLSGRSNGFCATSTLLMARLIKIKTFGVLCWKCVTPGTAMEGEKISMSHSASTKCCKGNP